MPEAVQRKLTTILAADAEGYSRLMEADEAGTLGALRAARGIFARFIDRHHGRIANTAGDGLIAEFPSVVEAVLCAIEVQTELGAHQQDPDGTLKFRIGVHLGDVIVDGDDLLGEGVNLAARLQSMAAPGDVLISQQVYDQVHSKLSVGFDYVGERQPKNYVRAVPIYRVTGAHGNRERPAGVYAPSPVSSLAAVDAPLRAGKRAQLIRRVKLFGVVWTSLLLVNIGAGGPFWSFWPGLAMAVLLGLQAAPLGFVRRVSPGNGRVAVLLIALALINLVTWSGYPWALWPIGAALAIALFRRFVIARS